MIAAPSCNITITWDISKVSSPLFAKESLFSPVEREAGFSAIST